MKASHQQTLLRMRLLVGFLGERAQCDWWLTAFDADVVLNVKLNENLHDREIRLDNGWVIKIGRGLDFYQKPASWFELGAHDLSLRKCLETKLDIVRA